MKIIATDRAGKVHELEGRDGWSVMEILRDGGHVSRNPRVLIELLVDLLPVRQAWQQAEQDFALQEHRASARAAFAPGDADGEPSRWSV